MPEARVFDALRRNLLQTQRGARATILRANPAKLLLFGYLAYMLFGWAVLSLPVMQGDELSGIDVFFVSVSAVSTTGLTPVTVSDGFSFGGALTILLLIQVGGVGYMTIGSFAVLATQERLSPLRQKMTKAAFSLPESCEPRDFIKTVILFTLVTEALGAIVLSWLFWRSGVDHPIWQGIFHSISAFCTAGFSLFPASLEAFRNDLGVNAAVSALSLLGSMGFLVVWDGWRNLTSRAYHLGFTSKVIIRMTGLFLLCGTAVLFVVEPSLSTLPPAERLLTAFFQTMTASTTVGFNTYPIGALSSATILILFLFMAIGASPSGTGGGLKTTTFAAMMGLLRSTLKQRGEVRFFKRPIPQSRVEAAAASFTYFVILCGVAAFVLSLTEPKLSLESLLFECISALGTVGLSTGITGDLSSLGKLIICILMTAGRVGILTFGIALAMHDESREEEEDNELLL